MTRTAPQVQRFRRACCEVVEQLCEERPEGFIYLDVLEKIHSAVQSEEDKMFASPQRVIARLRNYVRRGKLRETSESDPRLYLPPEPGEKGKQTESAGNNGSQGQSGAMHQEKLAKSCSFYYKRMRRQAPDKMPDGIDQGPGVGFNYFFGMKPEELEKAQQHLERLCYEHAPPLDNRMKRRCLTGIRRVGDPANKAELARLTEDQQQLVQEVLAKSDEREQLRIIGHSTLSFAKAFLEATGTTAGASRAGFLAAVAAQQQLNSSPAAEVSTTGGDDKNRPALPVVDPKLAEQFRVTGQQLAEKGRQQAHQQQEGKKHMEALEALERERNELKQQNEDLSQKVTDLTEERDTLAAEKKTAEERVTELEGQISRDAALAKGVEDAWTAAFAAVPDAKTPSLEAVEALKQHVAALEKAQKQAEGERDTARKERDALPTAKQLAAVKRERDSARWWRTLAWVFFGAACACVVGLTIWGTSERSGRAAAEKRAWEIHAKLESYIQ